MAKLHGLHDAIRDHGGTEPGPQSQKQHLATLVAPEGLHHGIIYDLHWAPECSFKVISHPASPEVHWFRKRSVSNDRTRVTDRYRIIFPVPREFLDASDHLFGSQRGPGGEFPTFFLYGREDLHVGSPYIDNQHIHDETSVTVLLLIHLPH